METIYWEPVVHEHENRLLLHLPQDGYSGDFMRVYKGKRLWWPQRKAWVIDHDRKALEHFKAHCDGVYAFVARRSGTLSQSSSYPQREAFFAWMVQHRYSDNTITTYRSCLDTFFHTTGLTRAQEITWQEVAQFNSDFILGQGFATSTQNQYLNAIKLYLRYMGMDEEVIDRIERPRKEHKLPEVLSKEEVKDLLDATRNLKHKALLSLIYASGLRIGEALRLELTDVDSKRMMLHIRSSKGRKDRYVPLARTLLTLLRDYFTQYRPKRFLFEGEKGLEYSRSSAAKVLKRACLTAGIRKSVTLHTLRHSYGTHMLEKGVDIRYIQELLGHYSPKTTMIYTHISQKKLTELGSPFDEL